jgi:polysaccharide pyruvyl transferase WcaK-like protein
VINKVFFSAKTQYENLGDGVIGCQLLNKMRGVGNVLVDDRMSPEWYGSILGIKDKESVRIKGGGFKRKLICSAMKSIFSSPHVYLALKPGHIFGGGSWLKEISYTGFMLLLWILRVRIVRYGASLGPFTRKAAFFERIKAFCFWDYTARDNLSLDYCKSLGISKVKYCPDMAFGLGYHEGDERKKYPLALSFRTGTTSEHETSYTENLERHLLSSSWVAGNKSQALFVSQVKRDDLYMKMLMDKLAPSAEMVTYSESIVSQKEVFCSYNKAALILSNRLHVLLFAASRGAIPVPMVEREKHLKIVGLFHTVGLDDLVFDISGDTSLNQHLININGRAKEIRLRASLVFVNQSKLI